MRRRDFFTILGAAAVAVPFAGSASHVFSESNAFEGHKFPELPYGFDALEPFVDAKTMELHYSKHHRGYYDKFIAAIKGTEAENIPVEKIFSGISKYPEPVRNNGGGFYNHVLYWENMTPVKTEIPENLKTALLKDFGSIDDFKLKFAASAKSHFGSGWAWLITDQQGRLAITTTPNQDNPLMDIATVKGVPLLCIDVWEHAYYLKYQNRRPEYVDNFMNLINWDEVNRRYLKTIR